jgi:hypothetical protein
MDLTDLRRLSGLGTKQEPKKIDYGMEAESALEDILRKIDDISDDVGHHMANLDDEQKMMGYGQTIADALIEAANKIKSDLGV